MGMKIAGAFVVGFFVLAAFLPGSSPTGSGARYTAVAVDGETSDSSSVQLVIDRWSTDEERRRVLEMLVGDGPDSLDGALKVMPRVGYIQTRDNLHFDLHYAHRTSEGDDEHVVLMSDPWADFWETPHVPRTIGHPFTLIEIRLDKDGEGEGKLSLATRVTADRARGTIRLELYDLRPALLQRVARAHGQR